MQGVWKMPTGLVNASEDVSEAAVREVLEVRSCLVTCRSISVLPCMSPQSSSNGLGSSLGVARLPLIPREDC